MKARFPIVLGVFLLGGCQMAEKKVIGQWDEESKSNNLLANMAVQGVPKGKLIFLDGHKFTFETAAMRTNPRDPRSSINHGHKIEGTWTLHDQDIDFTATSVDGGSVADFQTQEQKEIADEQSSLGGLTAPKNGQPLSPEQQQSFDKLSADMKSSMDKFAKELVTPIPSKGNLSSGFYTLTVECVGGKSLQFGKKQSDH